MIELLTVSSIEGPVATLKRLSCTQNEYFPLAYGVDSSCSSDIWVVMSQLYISTSEAPMYQNSKPKLGTLLPQAAPDLPTSRML